MADKKADDLETPYTPMLLIGLGGSGINAVRAIQFYADKPDIGPAFDSSLHKMTQNNMVCSIGIDTDGYEFTAKQINPDIYPAHIAQHISKGREYPPLNHTVHIEKFNLNENIKMAREYARHRLAEPIAPSDQNDHADLQADDRITGKFFHNILNIRDEFYDRLLPSGREVSEGAGQLRLLGRLAFFSGLQHIYQELAWAKDILGEATGPDSRKLRISIFCSLAGGTGSGMFMDLAILLRKKLFEDALISGYFLLPEIFSSLSQADRIWANSYAALRELATLARNSQDEPIYIPYHYGSSEVNCTLQKGDSAIFDEIFLFDETAGWADRNVEGGMREGSVQAAGRFMADAALAHSRRDIMAKAKSLQNVQISSDQGDARTRPVFNAIAATHLQPLEIYGLADIALRHWINKHCTDIFSQHYKEYLPDGLENFVNFHNDLVQKVQNAIQSRYDEVVREKSAGRKADISKESNLRLMHLAIKGYKNPSFFYATYQQVLKDEMSGESIFLHDEIISHFDKLNEKLHELLRNNQLEVDKERILFKGFLTYTKFFEGILSTAVSNWQEKLKKIHAELEDSGLPLANDIHVKLADLRKEFGEHRTAANKERGDLTLPVPQAAFRLRGCLDGYKGKDRQIYIENLKKKGPGNLVDDTKEFIAELSSIVEQIYKDSGCISESGDSNHRQTHAVTKLVDIMLADNTADELIGTLDKILALSNQRKDVTHRLITGMEQKVRDLVKTPELDGEEARYEKLMEPVDKTLQRFWEGEETLSKQAENEKNILVDALEKSLRSNMRNKGGLLTKKGRHILEKLRNRKQMENREDARPHLQAITTIAHREFFDQNSASDYIGDEKKYEEDLTQRIDEIYRFFHAVIGFLFSQPSFELARLGGEKRIRRLAKACKLALFSPDPSPGLRNYRYGIVAMPDNIKASDAVSSEAEAKIRKKILGFIDHELNVPVSLTDERSDIPLIYTEKRYYSAYQLKSLRKYYDHYMAVNAEQRVLYHTIQEAQDFPHLLTGLAVVDSTKMSQPWVCYAHEEGDRQIPADVQQCPLCRYEYEQGKRRYQDITYRQKKPDLLPIPWLNRNIPKKLIDYFFNGIPYAMQGNWSAQHGHSGSIFERLLKERGYDEPIRRGFRGSKQASFLFPAIFISPTNPHWHWVQRKDGKPEERFEHPYKLDGKKKLLHECYHCGFPVVYNPEDARHAYDCPRCQRSLYHCDVCSEKDGMLFEPKKDVVVQEDRCPRCDNLMHMHSSEGGCASSPEARVDDGEGESEQ